MKENIQKLKGLYAKNKEVINYLIFGVLTTIVSFVTYFIFAQLIRLTPIVSNGLSWLFAVLFAFLTNKIFVFESKEFNKKTILKEMASFFMVRVATGIMFDIGLFALLIEVIKINDIISKLITQILTIIANYVFSKLLVFKKKK